MDQTITAGQAFTPAIEFTFRVLLRHRREQGCFPSVSRIANICRLSVRQIQRHLKALEASGRIHREARRRTNGSQSSNGFSFPSLFCGADVTPDVTPLTAYECKAEDRKPEHNEPLPRFAQRETASASTDVLSTLRSAMQTTHSEVGRMPTNVSLRNAAAMHSALCEAVGKPVSIAQATDMMESLKRHGWMLPRKKRWFWVAGMIAYARNYFAAIERQTVDYRPENELAPAEMFTARTAFHDAADEEFEVAA